MATKLKKMKLTSVDLVRAGANQEADICLFKSADPPKATESPTEDEKNIFKRFLDWMRKNPTEAKYEPQSHIEKAEDAPDLEFIYKSALTESLQSIMKDDTLTETEKKAMSEESLRQYADKIRDLERDEEDYDGGDDIDDDDLDDDDEDEEGYFDEIEDSQVRKESIDVIEEVEKYNHNHGADGKFSSSPGAGGGGAAVSPGGAAGGMSPKQQKAIDHVMNGSSAYGYNNRSNAESAAKLIANQQRTETSVFDFGSTERKAPGRFYVAYGKEAKAIELSGSAKKVGTVRPDADLRMTHPGKPFN